MIKLATKEPENEESIILSAIENMAFSFFLFSLTVIRRSPHLNLKMFSMKSLKLMLSRLLKITGITLGTESAYQGNSLYRLIQISAFLKNCPGHWNSVRKAGQQEQSKTKADLS